MQVMVSGKGVEVGESLRKHAEAQIEEHVNKYIDRIANVQVVVSREAHNVRVDITANLGSVSCPRPAVGARCPRPARWC